MVTTMRRNIGFVSTRFAGTDGVSLESSKWSKVLEEKGHQCFWFAGKLDKDEKISFLASKADFKEKQNCLINNQLFNHHKKSIHIAKTIHHTKSGLADRLKAFIKLYNLDMLVVQNALAIPMNIPLGLALTDVIEKTEIPTIAHHHDFFWERGRYNPLNGNKIYIYKAFPPKLPSIKHVVINTDARKELALRRGIPSTVIPNVLDFENPPTIDKERIIAFKNSIGLKPDDIMILQPSRIVKRKGIEFTIQLVKELGPDKHKIVISHEAGDEGFEYAAKIDKYARENGIKIHYVHNMIEEPITRLPGSKQRYSLWEAYQAADLVTFPSLYEGFGNALIEAIYLKKPLLINRYKVFVDDIEPNGFDLIKMDGKLTTEIVSSVKRILKDRTRRQKIVEKNYRIAKTLYSFSNLHDHLSGVIMSLPNTGCRQNGSHALRYKS